MAKHHSFCVSQWHTSAVDVLLAILTPVCSIPDVTEQLWQYPTGIQAGSHEQARLARAREGHLHEPGDWQAHVKVACMKQGSTCPHLQSTCAQGRS
jgi:hypothetical protein